MKMQSAPLITQEAVEALSRANTMAEWTTIAKQYTIDWNALPDEWLTAIVQGDVTELLHQMQRKPKLGKGHKPNPKK